MESVNFINDFEEEKTNSQLEDEPLIGWSATCLDQTISYYVDCNFSEISQEDARNDC